MQFTELRFDPALIAGLVAQKQAALKAVLNSNGYAYGEDFDSVVAAEYKGQSDLETMVMADQFRTEFLETGQVGTANFEMQKESGDYLLIDHDMTLRGQTTS